MARILFTTFGSYGDLYPYIAIGRELMARGHHVTIGTSASYRPKVELNALSFAAIRPDLSLEDTDLLNYVFDQKRGTERILRATSELVRETYQDTLEASAGMDAIVTHPITFAAVLVARQTGVCWVSSVLAPISFLSATDPPVVAPAPWLHRLRVFGPSVMRSIFNLGRLGSLRWVRPVLDFARELGLPPGGHPVFEGSYSPSLVLAIFSRVFAPPQPDWPPNVVMTGFPFHDEDQSMAPELERFLEQQPAPVVFTLGSSAVGAAGAFYRESLAAVRRLGIRALFLTGPHGHGLPEELPPFALRCSYAPHRQVFTQAAAIVHQGGIGTTAQALRAGRPMLVVPFAHDQFDNAERVRRLEAGELLYRSRYKAERVRALLERLLENPAYRDAAARVASSIAQEDAPRTAADAIEGALRSHVPGPRAASL